MRAREQRLGHAVPAGDEQPLALGALQRRCAHEGLRLLAAERGAPAGDHRLDIGIEPRIAPLGNPVLLDLDALGARVVDGPAQLLATVSGWATPRREIEARLLTDLEGREAEPERLACRRLAHGDRAHAAALVAHRLGELGERSGRHGGRAERVAPGDRRARRLQVRHDTSAAKVEGLPRCVIGHE